MPLQERVELTIGETEILLENDYSAPTPHLNDRSVERQLDKTWESMVEIHKRAMLCDMEEESEPSWNEEVHSRVLDLALGDDKDEIGYRNM